jgi:hypothetical protein
MERDQVSARLGFAIYLEAAGSAHSAEQMLRRFGSAVTEAAKTRWSGQLIGPNVTAEAVQSALGTPDAQDQITLRYEMPTRPGYHYTFDFDSPTKHLRSAHFSRIEPIAPPLDLTPDLAQLRRALADIGATADEVRSWLGAPVRENGWWPWETWEYPTGLVLELRHGTVEDRLDPTI